MRLNDRKVANLKKYTYKTAEMRENVFEYLMALLLSDSFLLELCLNLFID